MFAQLPRAFPRLAALLLFALIANSFAATARVMKILNCFGALLFVSSLMPPRILSWLVCGIYATIPCYWMMVHPFAERWRAARYKLKLLVPLWIATWCIAWGVSYPWRNALLYHNAGSWLAAPLLWAVSGIMYVLSGRELSLRRAIGRHELEPELHPNELITSGVHRMVRHPMYLGHLCTMLGFALVAGTVACFALLFFALVGGAIMIVFEERELHDRFGPAWEEYRKRTPLIFPLPR